MNRFLIFFQSLVLLFGLHIQCGSNPDPEKKILQNPVFVFNNAFNKSDLSYDEQASLLAGLGFDGIEHRETKGILELKEALEKKELRLFTDYAGIDLDREEPYLPEWKEMIPKLEGSGIILWMHVHSKKFKPSDENADSLIIPILCELADLAKPYGVRIALYPHYDNLVERAEDSFRLAKKADRENVGAVFNLCHFLKCDSEENISKVIELILPKLFAVSINGADCGDTRNMNWDRLIQPLGEGTFDVYRIVELLADKGYHGPFGIQCYNIKGQPEDYLSKSSQAWQDFRKRYSQHKNVFTQEEKKEN